MLDISDGTTSEIRLPDKFRRLFQGPARYRCAYGGRGSSKTRSFAVMSAVYAYKYPINVLCAREFQNSLDESSFEEVRKAIESHQFLKYSFEVGKKYIYGPHGNRYYFSGLSRGLDSVKSKAAIGVAWVDEGEGISDPSFRKLFPTVRGDIPSLGFNSEIWLGWNPESVDSPIHTRFRINTPDNCRIIKINYTDNPWFPASLREDMEHDFRVDSDMAAHTWLGEIITRSEAQVFNGKWKVDRFEVMDADGKTGEGWEGPYQGVDFGFSTDPFAAVRLWIKGRDLFVEYAVTKLRLENDDTATWVNRKIPRFEKYVIRADSAEPKSISYLSRKGLPRITASKKWPNSIVQGIKYMRSFDNIIIHERAVDIIKEARLYSHKIDKRTQDILPDIADANNHCWDACRYAISPMIHESEAEGRIRIRI